MKGKTFASFNLNSFLNYNVKPYEFNQSTFSFQARENEIQKNEYKERRTVLLIRNIENLKSDLKINESFFNDLPENYEPIRLIIKKR